MMRWINDIAIAWLVKITNLKLYQIWNSQRYGHCSIYVNGYAMVIGGFMMNDSIGAEPVTLDSCEKYHFEEDVWTEAAELNVQRSYAGVWKFNDNFVYVFGGLK